MPGTPVILEQSLDAWYVELAPFLPNSGNFSVPATRLAGGNGVSQLFFADWPRPSAVCAANGRIGGCGKAYN